jgi:hypothetical protein
VNHHFIRFIRVIRGSIVFRREGGGDFRHEFHESTRIKPRVVVRLVTIREISVSCARCASVCIDRCVVFDFSAVKPRKDFPKQLAMFLQQFLGKLFVPLTQRAVAHHVGKHDGGKPTLFS